MIPRLKVFHRGLILVAVPFLLELALIVGLGLLLYQSDQEQLQEANYRKIAAVNARLMILTSQVPYYLINSIRFSSNEIFRVYENKRDQVFSNQKKLIELLKKTPDLADGADEIQSSIDKVMSITEEIASARKERLPNLLSKMPKIIETYNQEKSKILEHLAKMLRSGEIRTGEIQKQQALIRYRQTQILLFGFISNIVASIILGIFFRHTVASRLRTIMQNTLLLSKNEKLKTPLKGADEIAQLDLAFHHMDDELRLAAQRERELFDNASDVICVMDYENKFVKVNLASQRNWGYSPERLASMRVEEIVHKDDMNAMLDQIARGKLTAEAFVFENRLITACGSQIEASWSAFWSQLDRQLYCVVHDISERKRTERMKQKFLSMISSDLKTPLSAMSGAVAILLGSLAESPGAPPQTSDLTPGAPPQTSHLSPGAPALAPQTPESSPGAPASSRLMPSAQPRSSTAATLSATAQDKLQIAGKNLQRLLGLVNDLLQVTEMENSTIDIKKELCDTEEPLMRSIQEVETLADKRSIKLQLDSCQVQWYVDPNRIVQVLVNLLSNAIKFSPEGATVFLSAVEHGDMIEVKVKDQGRGVPESHRQAIFEKFKQVEAADGKRKSGTGLGLPICKQIVEDHGGNIGVDSLPEQGSTFWFLIPRDETVSLNMRLQNRKAEPGSAGFQPASDDPRSSGKSPTEAGWKPALPGANIFGRLKLGLKGTILVGVPLIFELILVCSMSSILVQVDHERKQELYYRNIAFQSTKIINMYFMMVIGSIEGEKESDWLLFKEGYRTSQETLEKLGLTLKNDQFGRKCVRAAQANNDKFDEFVANGDAWVKKHASAKGAMGGKEKMVPSIMKSTHQLERLCEHSEKKELTSPERQKELRLRQFQILFLALGANIAGALALTVFFSSDIVSRLQILADNAMRLAREIPLNKPLSGSDEITDLDRTFHTTAQSLSEARKKERAVFDNSQDLICSLNKESGFQSANPAAEAILGFAKDELKNKTLEDIVHEEDRESVKKLAQITAGEHLSMELRVIRKDKSLAYTRWSYSRGAEHGDVLCVVHDITNLKELEQIKSDFLAMVSHDLRTPLTSVLGITKLILAGAFGAVDDRPKRILLTITKSGEQLLELINDLLDIEKLEAGKMQLVLEECKVDDLLKRAASQSRDGSRILLKNDHSQSGGTQVITTTKLLDLPPSEKGLLLKADLDRLVQAISNLLNHSLDRSPADSTVTISLRAGDKQLNLEIEDAAPLLSEIACRQLFDRFQTLDTASAAESSSKGLGLPIAKKIIESHGGSISALTGKESNTIQIKLPLKVSD